MKAVQLAVVLLIVCISSVSCNNLIKIKKRGDPCQKEWSAYLNPAEALKCNKCTQHSNTGACTNTVQTCGGTDEVCASIVCTYPIRTVTMKTCIKSSATYIFENDPNCEISTCSTDRCN